MTMQLEGVAGIGDDTPDGNFAGRFSRRQNASTILRRNNGHHRQNRDP
jgi:hypothetical protein